MAGWDGENLDIDTSTDIRVSLDGLKAPPKDPGKSRGDTSITHARTTSTTSTTSSTGANGATGVTRTPATSISTGTRTSIRKPVSNDFDITGWVLRGAIAIVAIIGLWWGYSHNVFNNLMTKNVKPNRTNPGMAPVTSPTAAAKTTTTTGGQELEMSASAPDYTVSIYSNPDKARIVIDGVDTGEFTPHRLTRKANTPFSLRLVKEGYTDLVTTVTPTYEAYSFTGTMQILPRVASVYINIVNGGVNPELRIAGVPVSIRSSREPYLIQAEVGVKVQAFNKVTGFTAEKTITIPANQKQTIDLYLK